MLIEAADSDFRDLIAGTAVGGFPIPGDSAIAPPDVLEMLRILAASIRPGFDPCAWIIVEEGQVMGLCSLTRGPTAGDLHIGYGVAPSVSGRGVTTRAIGALLSWARDDDRVLSLSAETGVDNIASQRVLERNGFTRIGTRVDAEDGDLICWFVMA